MTTSGSTRCARARYPRHAVSFGVARGEILGVAGLVGAGRSEVAAAIAGVEPPIAGTIVLDGTTLAIAEPADAIGHGVFLVPEDRRSAGLVVASSIRENVSLPALHRYSTYGLVSEARERDGVGAICRQLQVKAPSIEVATATLSGGNQQKVALAKWLVLGPRVLIVDEPTRGIDVGAKAEIYRLLRELARQGVSIVMISSDMEEVLLLSDRVAVMSRGAPDGHPRTARTAPSHESWRSPWRPALDTLLRFGYPHRDAHVSVYTR